MPKINLLMSICIFSILLGITSTIKNQTRIIEKEIYKITKKELREFRSYQHKNMGVFMLELKTRSILRQQLEIFMDQIHLTIS